MFGLDLNKKNGGRFFESAGDHWKALHDGVFGGM
jgi:hypothetical protein